MGEQKVRVLVADDDDGVRRMLEVFFLGQECDVTSVADGTAALLHANDGGWDLVVTDYAMPWASGLEVLKAARARMPETRLVLISGGAIAKDVRHEAESLGALVEAKPVSLATLKGLVTLASSKASLP